MDPRSYDRRRLLAMGGTLVTAGLSGCSFGSGGDESPTKPPTEDDTTPEPGAAREDPRTIGYDEAIRSELQDDDGSDPKFRDIAEPVQFDGRIDDVVEIGMAAESFTAYLVLEAPSGNVVGLDEDADNSTKSVIWRRLPETGTYTVWAGSLEGTATGTYTLSLEQAKEREPFIDFPSISVGSGFQGAKSYDGQITEAPPVDPFWGDLATPIGLDIEAPTTLEISLRSDTVDPFLLIETPNGVLLESNDDVEEGDTNSQIREHLQTGLSIAWAGTYSGDATGSFTLSVTSV